MPQFFIDRPVFAWVLAILIALGGTLAVVSPPGTTIHLAGQIGSGETIMKSAAFAAALLAPRREEARVESHGGATAQARRVREFTSGRVYGTLGPRERCP